MTGTNVLADQIMGREERPNHRRRSFSPDRETEEDRLIGGKVGYSLFQGRLIATVRSWRACSTVSKESAGYVFAGSISNKWAWSERLMTPATTCVFPLREKYATRIFSPRAGVIARPLEQP
jgi:hypothetical protein